MGTVMPSKPERQQGMHGQHDTTKSSKRPLEPVDRISEIWFGLIIVLTFTCSLSVKTAGQEEVRTMIIAAVGCNVTWGILDSFMYLLGCFVERGRSISALRALRMTADAGAAQRIIAGAMPPLLASMLTPAEFDAMRQNLNRLPAPPAHPRLTREELLGGLAVFSAVFLSTFPVVIPFLFIADSRLALRISNGVAVVMLFLTGYAFGRYAGYRPWRMGILMAVVGSALVALAVVLGG